MKVLLDVNILLAYGWKQHSFHTSCSEWLEAQPEFALCPITALGFLRVSMSPAFKAGFADATRVLNSLSERSGVTQLSCDVPVQGIPIVSSYQDTTDAYLVHLARHHSYRFATLDEGILNKEWAADTAFNPVAD